MMKFFGIVVGILFLIGYNGYSKDCYKEIHSKHFFYGMPKGTPDYNDLIIRDSYALSSNDSTKFADWVAYMIDSVTITGTSVERNWSADPWLDSTETLEPEDYKDANKSFKYDRGHQAPLANFKGNRDIESTNFLSNITPQKAELNQGSWKDLEDWERKLVLKYGTLYIMTGPLYNRTESPLPKADEPHKVPGAYWKIITIITNKNEFKTFGFVFDQNTPRKSPVKEHLAKVNEIEKLSGLDFFSDLPDNKEEKFEETIDLKWFEENFGLKD